MDDSSSFERCEEGVRECGLLGGSTGCCCGSASFSAGYPNSRFKLDAMRVGTGDWYKTGGDGDVDLDMLRGRVSGGCEGLIVVGAGEAVFEG